MGQGVTCFAGLQGRHPPPPRTRNRTTASSGTFPDVKPYVKICRRSKIQLHLITQRGAASDLTWDDSGTPRCLAGCGVYSPPAGQPGRPLTACHGAVTRTDALLSDAVCVYLRLHQRPRLPWWRRAALSPRGPRVPAPFCRVHVFCLPPSCHPQPTTGVSSSSFHQSPLGAWPPIGSEAADRSVSHGSAWGPTGDYRKGTSRPGPRK